MFLEMFGRGDVMKGALQSWIDTSKAQGVGREV